MKAMAGQRNRSDRKKDRWAGMYPKDNRIIWPGTQKEIIGQRARRQNESQRKTMTGQEGRKARRDVRV